MSLLPSKSDMQGEKKLPCNTSGKVSFLSKKKTFSDNLKVILFFLKCSVQHGEHNKEVSSMTEELIC